MGKNPQPRYINLGMKLWKDDCEGIVRFDLERIFVVPYIATIDLDVYSKGM